MRHIAWLLLLWCFCAQAALHAVSSITLPPQMLLPAQEKISWPDKNLRVGILQDNGSPWNIVVGSDLYGVNADYLNAIAHHHGLQLTINGYADLPALLAALQQGKIDLIFGVPKPLLPTQLAISQPWFSSPLRIYRSRSNQRPVMFNSREAQLAISRESYALLNPDFAASHHWRLFDNDLQALYALLNQRSDYVVADETTAGFLLSQLQQGQIYQLASSLEPGQRDLVAAASDRALIARLNTTLRQLPLDMVNAIENRWNTPQPRYQDTRTSPLTALEQNWLQQHPQATYAALRDDYPWSYRDSNGMARGYSVELLNAVAQTTGLTFQPHWVDNPQQAAELLSQSRVDLQLMHPLTGNEGNNATLPVWRALWGVYTRMPSSRAARWQDLQGQRVGVRRGDLGRELVPAGIQVREFDTPTALYDALNSGQIDAVVDNVLSARWLIAARYNATLQLAFAASDTAWPIAFGVSAQAPLLRQIMDKGLLLVPADTQQRLRDYWSNNSRINTGDTMMRSVSQLLLLAAVLAIVILLILLARRYLQQRREQQQRLALERQRAEAERASQMKSQFLATVSHELRTPMQAILGLLELEIQQSTANKRLAIVHSSARSLMTLLNDLQDHAKIESNTFSLTPEVVDLRRWLEQLNDLYQPLMPADGPRLIVAPGSALPPAVWIDSARLQQIAVNLIGNAIKFTRSGSITVTLSVDEQISLRVVDSGIGIAQEEQARLFEPWYQAPSGKTRRVQGSGLGLSICRELVTRMGGTITLTSAPGSGTEVSVTLPLMLAPAMAPTAEEAPLSFADRSHCRIAIVDDNPTNLLVMAQQLAALGVNAECYADGRALLAADARQPFDLLFIDRMMPRPDGLLLAAMLRRRERQRTQRALLVLCTADAQMPDDTAAMRHVDHLLLKPVSQKALAAILHTLPGDPLQHLSTDIRRLASDNEAFIPRICQTLHQTFLADREALQAAIAQNDYATIEQAAHRMKGSWLLLGQSQGERLCQQLIDCAKQHNLSQAEAKLLISLTDRLLLTLESYGAHSFPR